MKLKDFVAPTEFSELLKDHTALRGKVYMLARALMLKGLITQEEIDEAGRSAEEEFCKELGIPYPYDKPAKSVKTKKTKK